MSRKTQMWALMLLTGVSLAPVYWMLGWQSGGHGPDTVSESFWLIEAIAWSLRAVLEGWALVYLAQTWPQTEAEERIRARYENLLIGLIAITVGLVIVANGNRQAIATGLWSPLFWLWAFAVASFAPLMLRAVGFAYRAQPESYQVQQRAQRPRKEKSPSAKPNSKPQSRIAKSATVAERRRRVAQLAAEGLRNAEIAQILNTNPYTVSRDLRALRRNGKEATAQ